MKKAEDFRKAFGPAEPGFEKTVRNTLNKLLLQEDKSAFRRLYRYRIPALATAMVLFLSVGVLAFTGLGSDHRGRLCLGCRLLVGSIQGRRGKDEHQYKY